MDALGERFAAELEAGAEVPSLLIGWSFGGVAALFTARALEAREMSTPLVMIDSTPRLPGDPPVDTGGLIGSFEALRKTGHRGSATVDKLAAGLDAPALRRVERLAAHNERLAVEHLFVGRLASPVTAIEAADDSVGARMARLEAATSGRFALHRTSGDHFSMFDSPNIESLAGLIDRVAAAAR